MKNQRWAILSLLLIATAGLTFFAYLFSHSTAGSRIHLNYISCDGTNQTVEFKQGFTGGGPCVSNIISSTPIYPRRQYVWAFYVTLTAFIIVFLYALPKALKHRKKAVRYTKKAVKHLKKKAKSSSF